MIEKRARPALCQESYEMLPQAASSFSWLPANPGTSSHRQSSGTRQGRNNVYEFCNNHVSIMCSNNMLTTI